MWKILIIAAIVHCVLSKSSSKCDSNGSDKYKVKHINTHCSPKFSISIVWDEETSSALWVDYGVKRASKPCLYRYDSINGKTYKAYVEDNGAHLPAPTSIIPVRSSSNSLSKILVGLGVFIYELAWDGKSKSASIIKKVLLGDDNEAQAGPHERQGLAHRDPSGKTLYATYLDTRLCAPAENQSVFVKQNGGIAQRELGPNKVYTGFAYVGPKVYTIVSCTNRIFEIVKNNVAGRVVFELGNHGHYLGLEAGSDGTLYTCGYNDGYLYAIDLKAKTKRRVAKLGKGITSVTFGGKNKYGGDDLYVTRATKYLQFSNGKFKGRLNKKRTLYRVCTNKAGVVFKRINVTS